MLERIKDITSAIILGFVNFMTALTVVIMIGGTVAFIVIAIIKTI